MKEYLTNRSPADELVRLKKSVQFIYEIVRSYANGPFDHVGLSCALAISKAEELKGRVSPFCPAYEILNNLIQTLKQLYSGDRETCQRAEAYLAAISNYFNLPQNSSPRRMRPDDKSSLPR